MGALVVMVVGAGVDAGVLGLAESRANFCRCSLQHDGCGRRRHRAFRRAPWLCFLCFQVVEGEKKRDFFLLFFIARLTFFFSQSFCLFGIHIACSCGCGSGASINAKGGG